MIMELCMLFGFLAVASNPSPYFAALGLVGSSGVGCIMLAKSGESFLSLVLFLIYLGGMMVVFAYCAALVAEPYPEAWGSWVYTLCLIVYVVMMLFWGVQGWGGEGGLLVGGEYAVVSNEWWGTGGLMSCGGWMMFLGGWALLLTLFLALELVRGYKWGGTLRAV